MNLGSFFSLKDIFNYFIAGFIWVLDFILLLLVSLRNANRNLPLLSPKEIFEPLDPILTGILLFLVPYIVGFLLSPSGEWVKKLWQGANRSRYPDPMRWVIDHSEKKLKGKRIPKDEATRIRDLMAATFPGQYKRDIHLWFFPVRAFVLEKGGRAAELSVRVRDLMNFTESLLLPLPLFIFLMAVYVISVQPIQETFNLGVCLICLVATLASSFIVHLYLVKRYFKLEIYWVKHVYRAFLAIHSGDSLKT
jgi:hypothetical protein